MPEILIILVVAIFLYPFTALVAWGISLAVSAERRDLATAALYAGVLFILGGVSFLADFVTSPSSDGGEAAFDIPVWLGWLALLGMAALQFGLTKWFYKSNLARTLVIFLVVAFFGFTGVPLKDALREGFFTFAKTVGGRE